MGWSVQEMLKLCDEWRRPVVRYFIIGLIGIVALSFAASAFKAAMVKKTLNQAEILIQANRPGEALDRITAMEPWAAPYPALERRFACAGIKCEVALGDMPSAANRARELVDSRLGGFRVSLSPFVMFKMARNWLVNIVLSCLLPEGELAPWAGYATLIQELSAMGGHENLIETLRKEMPAGDDIAAPRAPATAPAPLTQDDQKAAPEPVDTEPAPEAVVAEKTPADGNIDEKSAEPPSPARKSVVTRANKEQRIRLAEKYIAEKNWSEATRECERVLTSDPTDSRAFLIKTIAQAHGIAWGLVTSTNAKAYTASDASLPIKLEPGMMVEITGVKHTKNTALAVCAMTQQDGAISDVLVPARELQINAGALNKLSEHEKKLRAREGQLLAETSKIRREYLTEMNKRNPSAAELKSAKAAYDAFWAKVKELTAKRDAARGDERTEYMNELRRLKGEDVKVGQALEAAKKKFKEWEDEKALEPINNPRLRELETELRNVREQLHKTEKEQ